MHITTEQLAAQLGIKPGTLRHRLCVHGSYFGLEPIKLPNRRLLWPSDAVSRLASSSNSLVAPDNVTDSPAKAPT